MTHFTITIRPLGTLAGRTIVKHTTSKLGTLWALWQFTRATAVYDAHGTTKQIVKDDGDDGIIILFQPRGATSAVPIIDVTIDKTPIEPNGQLQT